MYQSFDLLAPVQTTSFTRLGLDDREVGILGQRPAEALGDDQVEVTALELADARHPVVPAALVEQAR